MEYVCAAPDRKSWFRIETEAEAEREYADGSRGRDVFPAGTGERDPELSFDFDHVFGQNISLQAHIQREMPLFLTLRDAEGGGLATAMLPPSGRNDPEFKIIIVGKDNSDPYAEHGAAIHALGAHFGLMLDRRHCYPYGDLRHRP